MKKLAALAIASVLALSLMSAADSAAAARFTPREGVTFNSPLGSRPVERAIFNKIINSINGSPRGSDIKILSWNFLTREGATALLRAQRRGVRVRILMDDVNNTEIVNQPWRRLKSGLRAGNKGRPKKRQSWARVCVGSCRGKTGSAHSKFFVFSQVGRARNVVIQGSANLTIASTRNQWNDIYTYVGDKDVYGFASKIFLEAAADKPLGNPLAVKRFGGHRLIMFPLTKKRPDPVMQVLNQVVCRGAKNTANGRTVIRIAPDVIRQNRGMRLARKIRDLWNRGCNIRIGYTVVGIDIGRLLRSGAGRGPVPMKHLVQDFNGDGEFDNYFHLKAMSIVGHMGKQRRAFVTLNGSANWSGLAGVSDENLGLYYSRGITLKYQGHLNYWYDNFPKPPPPDPQTARSGASGQLIFGWGKKAVYEDGTPLAGDVTFKPFAHGVAD